MWLPVLYLFLTHPPPFQQSNHRERRIWAPRTLRRVPLITTRLGFRYPWSKPTSALILGSRSVWDHCYNDFGFILVMFIGTKPNGIDIPLGRRKPYLFIGWLFIDHIGPMVAKVQCQHTALFRATQHNAKETQHTDGRSNKKKRSSGQSLCSASRWNGSQ